MRCRVKKMLRRGRQVAFKSMVFYFLGKVCLSVSNWPKFEH